MKIVYKYFKNSNTGDLIKMQTVTETKIHGFHVYWYRDGKSIGEDLQPIGYVEITEKKFNRESKRECSQC